MPIFIVAITFDWIGALLALLLLKPLRIRWVSGQARTAGPSSASPLTGPEGDDVSAAVVMLLLLA
jgi:hypothetical protein